MESLEVNSLPQILQFWLITDPDRENLHLLEKQSFPGMLNHFLALFDNIEQNSFFPFCELPFAM